MTPVPIQPIRGSLSIIIMVGHGLRIGQLQREFVLYNGRSEGPGLVISIHMSNILDQSGYGYYEQPNTFHEYLLQFVRSRRGQPLERTSNTMVLQYAAQIDELQAKSILLCMEERKNSYKLSFSARVDIGGIPGGKLAVLKMVDEFNNSMLNENIEHSYTFAEPSMFVARAIIEKETLQEVSVGEAKAYIQNVLEGVDKNFTMSLRRLVIIICFRKVKETIELLNISKTYFQMEVKKRMRDPRPERAFTLSPFSKPNPYVISEEIKTCSEEEISRLHACLRKIKHDKSKDEEESCIKPLVYKIKMVKDDVDLNWKAPQSSYGHLEKLTAEFVILESFNNETAELLSKESKSEKTDCRMLVRKNFSKNPSCAGCVKELNPSCQCYVAYRSFRTEVEIISYIRNVITESIAEYFLEDNPRQQNEIENLYSQYYSQSLLGFNITSKQLLLFVIQLIEGLKMLNTSYVIHRDLKPNNIMISFKRGPKIIDFGSAYELKGNISDKKIGQELLTTKKYNLLYSEAEFPEKYQMAPHEFERHPLYDIYAFGVIVKELYSNPSLCSELGNLVVANLAWLVRMCTLENPDARISHDEALYFCHMLYRIWAAKNGFFSL